MPLKYLFRVIYRDGTLYQQGPDDTSQTDLKRSCFFDLIQDQIRTFELSGDGHTYRVNLDEGHFEVDGVPFRMHEGHLENIRLIYFRRHTHHFNAQTLEQKSHNVVFRFGWQAIQNGENVQRVMEID